VSNAERACRSLHLRRLTRGSRRFQGLDIFPRAVSQGALLATLIGVLSVLGEFGPRKATRRRECASRDVWLRWRI
jgi:hypothetical protein